MNITWKDAFATVAVLISGIIAYAKFHSWAWPLLGSYRTASMVVLGLGFASCIIVGSGVTSLKSVWERMAAVLGTTAFILGLFGMIFASKVAFVSLVLITFVLWGVTSLRHILGAAPGVDYR